MSGLSEENLIRQFLLGELPPDERERVGERLFADEEFLAQVDAVEEELIDDFARGRLDASERERFERYFIITEERQARLRFARDFHRALSSPSPPLLKDADARPARDTHSGLWAWLRGRRMLALGFAVSLLLICSGAILFWRSFGGRNSHEQTVSTQGPHTPASLDEQQTPASRDENARTAGDGNQSSSVPEDRAAGNRAQPHAAPNTQANEAVRLAESQKGSRRPAAAALAIALEPGSLRGEAGFKKFAIPKGTKAVLLTLNFDDDEAGATHPATTYEVELQNGEIKTIYQATGLRSSSARGGESFVSVSVPAGLLPAGNYHVVLRQRGPDGKTEGVGSYYFSIAGGSRP